MYMLSLSLNMPPPETNPKLIAPVLLKVLTHISYYNFPPKTLHSYDFLIFKCILHGLSFEHPICLHLFTYVCF